jgi:hypothetical protein
MDSPSGSLISALFDFPKMTGSSQIEATIDCQANTERAVFQNETQMPPGILLIFSSSCLTLNNR